MHRRRAPAAAMVLVVFVVLAFTACRGQNDSTAATGQPLAATAVSAPAARRSPASLPPRTGPLADRLSRGLLSVHNLPGGWKLSQEARGDPEDTDLCGTNLASLEQQRTKLAEVEAGFDRGASGLFLVHAITAYPEVVAQRMLDGLAAVQACQQLVIRDDEGTLTTWELTPLSAPSSCAAWATMASKTRCCS
jgi:hypothetical protein